MTTHAWIFAVLDDIVAYAERNDLPVVARDLAAAARRFERLLDPRPSPVPGEPPCDVIHLPVRRMPGSASPQSDTKVCSITFLRN